MFFQKLHRFVCNGLVRYGYEDSTSAKHLQAHSGRVAAQHVALPGRVFIVRQGDCLVVYEEGYTFFEKLTLWLAAIL